MKTISIIVDKIEENLRVAQVENLLKNVNKVVIVFIAQEKWFNYNDPRNALASMNVLNHSEKVWRDRIIQCLSQIEKEIKIFNNKTEIVKIVVFGEEKYKVTKCLKMLKVEMCLFKNKKKNVLTVLFNKPLHEFINEKLKIPVVLL
jgi:hypothetical protein